MSEKNTKCQMARQNTRVCLQSIHTILMQSQLQWAGHIYRMEDHRIPKRLLYGQLSKGKRSQGGQRKRFRDTLNASLKAFSIDPGTWETEAHDRASWRRAVKTGAQVAGEKRTMLAEEKRQKRKARPTTLAPAGITCPVCGRTFRAHIGLTSHMRRHKTPVQSPQPPG
ncbi:uncharacterized protein LOC129923269 [Biomphalaria glabrata]|uniref:Uncharacterized protein LOC129923269 n=1 Tax=Biomphalaria glabrata TaxID=6526 RepID=A0A9W2Z3K1_BIOGL|nr:uncharacterized protein LOC129923269 [Biomphalaria glabrata]